ncbi:MAG: ABC transporter substrate-binding protein [Deferribacteraceae bacterium]|nr:ABC transporter substrate-binding protein [Deferribacteraceae bacterium]
MFLSACNKNRSTESADDTITVGIAKLIAHPALDMMEKGVIDELAEQGFDNITIDLQNANGDVNTNAEIANHFKNNKTDVVVAITSTTVLAMAHKMKDTPIIFVGVTDPVDIGVRTTLEPEETNITGISDMPPVRDEIMLIKKILPDVKRIGNIYSPGETNSVTQMELAKGICEELGIELVVSPVHNTAEVKQAAEVLAPKVDAFFVSKDNYVVAALNSLTNTAMAHKVPVISADTTSAPDSKVLAAYGLDTYLTGRAAGKLVARVLKGENPGTIAVRNPDELSSYVNPEVAAELGITLPDGLFE